MSFNKDLLLATLHANHAQKGDFTGKEYREELKECAAKAPSSGGSGSADLSAIMETTYTDTLTWDGDLTDKVYAEVETEAAVFYFVKMCDVPETDFRTLNTTTCFWRTSFDNADATIYYQEDMSNSKLDIFAVADFMVAIAKEDNVTFGADGISIAFPETGLYIQAMGAPGEAPYIYFTEFTVVSPIFPVNNFKRELLTESAGYRVNITQNTDSTNYISDKSIDSIMTAYNAGRYVYCVVDGIHIPLTKVHEVTLSDGTTVISHIEFVHHQGACYRYVSVQDNNVANVESLGIAVSQSAAPVILPNMAENKGKMLYVDSNGNIAPLTLGDGLSIVDGVLTITT